MHHLVLGIDPTELGMAPFALATADALHLWAEEIELRLHPDARIYILPCIAGHVGADAAAVALSESPHRSDELMLVVDVGTNAEILLGNRSPRARLLLARPAPPSRARRSPPASAPPPAPSSASRSTRSPRSPASASSASTPGPTTRPSRPTPASPASAAPASSRPIAEMRLAGLLDASGLIGSAEQTGTDRMRPPGPHPRLPAARRHPRHPGRRPRHPARASRRSTPARAC